MTTVTHGLVTLGWYVVRGPGGVRFVQPGLFLAARIRRAERAVR